MKNQLLVGIALLALITICGGYSNGAFQSGAARTGAPGLGSFAEGTCSGCHGGGSYGEPELNITVTDVNGGPARTTFVPEQDYLVTVQVSAPMGNPGAYGFQSQFLDRTPVAGTSRGRAGSVVSTDAGTRAQTQTSNTPNGPVTREYIEHSAPNTQGTFTFVWRAPDASVDEVDYYVVGNSVDNQGGTGNDNGSTAPTVVTLTRAAALPLDLRAFTAAETSKSVRLNWTTENESGTDRFAVERSATGQDFIEIGTVAAAGDSQEARRYAFTDAAPLPSAYYRLRMQDLDGSATFSPIVTATLPAAISLRAFPNPTVDILQLQLPATEAAALTVELFSVAGTQVGSVRTEAGQGGLTASINVSHLPRGIYLARVAELNQTVRFVKR